MVTCTAYPHEHKGTIRLLLPNRFESVANGQTGYISESDNKNPELNAFNTEGILKVGPIL